jgi:hypothetical protein
MYKGLIESESLKNKEILKTLKANKSHKEHHSNQETKKVTVFKLKIPENLIFNIINKLSKEYMKSEWYSLFWNSNKIFVVFENKIIKLKNINPWDRVEIEALTKYATSHGIQKKHIDNLRNTLETLK